MAKGIGNGFPLAAVITTPEIASSLRHALHFNTFGGNPLACAVGSAVLDVRTVMNRKQILMHGIDNTSGLENRQYYANI